MKKVSQYTDVHKTLCEKERYLDNFNDEMQRKGRIMLGNTHLNFSPVSSKPHVMHSINKKMTSIFKQ